MASQPAPAFAPIPFGVFASKIAWLPLACVLWLFAPHRVVRVDTPEHSDGYTTYRGFPLLSESNAPDLGMYRDHYLAPALFNFVFFSVVAWLLVFAWRRQSLLRNRALDWCVGIPLYIVGAFAFVFCLMWLFVLDGLTYWWPSESIHAGHVPIW